MGTNTLREGQNALSFLELAEEAFGYPIEVISGREEARLIFRGVVRDVDSPGSLLVIDIGGGSTELILGEGSETTRLDSLYMGCVSYTRRFFSQGKITSEAMEYAITAARRELQVWFEPIEKPVGKMWWAARAPSTPSSKSFKPGDMLTSTRMDWTGSKRSSLRWGIPKIFNSRVSPSRRREVLAGGIAVLSALFQGCESSECKPPPKHFEKVSSWS